MPQAANGDTVRVHYRGTLADGSEFDASEESDPLEVTLGAGEVIPGFEQALVGMSPGENKTVCLTADQAYGPYQEELAQEVERAQIPSEVSLEVGSILQASDPNGQAVRVTVKAVNDSHVTLDLNHPLAGKDLTFELRLVEIADTAA